MKISKKTIVFEGKANKNDENILGMEKNCILRKS